LVFNKRELAIGVIALGALLLFALDYYALTPFLAYRAGVKERFEAVSKQLDDADQLKERAGKAQLVWKGLLAKGLKTTASDAESQTLNAVRDWAQDSAMGLTSVKPEHVTQDDKDELRQIGFHAMGVGPMASVARMLWRLEAAPIPLRVNSVQIMARKEATDDLAVQLSIATVCYNPEAGKAKSAPAPSRTQGETP
jgi:hypothetical protein